MRYLILSIFLIISCSGLVWGQSEKHPQRLTFKAGQTKTVVRGYLKSRNDSANYVLRVRAHQSIEVRVCGEGISIRTDTLNSAGKSGEDNDMQGNSGFANTAAGDYKVSVMSSGKDDRHRGHFCVEISIIEYKP